MKRDKVFYTGVILAAVYLILLVPIINAGLYAHSVGDDYTYSVAVHRAVVAGGGAGAIIKEAVQTVARTYTGWQGTFSAVLLFAMQPGAFSQELYGLTTILMLTGLTASVLFFMDTFIVKVAGQRRAYGIIIGLLMLINMVEFVPDKIETFFWFNGSSYYTLFFSFALIWAALLMRIYTGNIKMAGFIVAALLSVIIGGGNYTTVLICLEISAIAAAAGMKTKKKDAAKLIVIFAVLLASFLVSALAPGNAVRAVSVNSTAPVPAIAKSIYYAARFMASWTGLIQISMIAMCLPIIYKAAKNCDHSFRYPVLVLGAAFLLFASQLTPPLYAMSNYGSGRQIDIYYYSYYLLLMFSVFYISGWVSHNTTIGTKRQQEIKFGNIIWAIAFCIIIWGMGCIGYGPRSMTSISTALAQHDQQLAEYDAQYNEMINTIESAGKDRIVEVEPLKTVPSCFLQLNMSEDPEFWINKSMADYFGVKGIAIKTADK